LSVKKDKHSDIDVMRSLLPVRSKNAHKGLCGRVGIVAGSSTMLGAAILTAKAALRTGSGLVYLLTVPEAAASVNAAIPEVVVLPLPSKEGVITEEAFSKIDDYYKQFHFHIMAIGPGLGRMLTTQSLVKQLLPWAKNYGIPLVIDADALFAISIEQLKDLVKDQAIITPHPKEFEFVFGVKVDPKKRREAAEKAGRDSKQIIVLKGQNTVIANNQLSFVNSTGNEGLATAGSGDVLTGIITSLIGQAVPPLSAARLGVFIHGLAGDYLKVKNSTYSLIASDIIDTIGAVYLELLKQNEQ